jgi:4-hydroxy-3-methylbut-2-enyl diphosphate reductase
MDNITKIMVRLKKIIPQVSLHNTTCRTTRVKQKEIESLPVQNDVVLIIGSRISANTKRLYQISRRINKKTHWIECTKDIRSSWFSSAKKVGVMAGASTPDNITQEVVAKLERMKTS